jgi:hypothetical protein
MLIKSKLTKQTTQLSNSFSCSSLYSQINQVFLIVCQQLANAIINLTSNRNVRKSRILKDLAYVLLNN